MRVRVFEHGTPRVTDLVRLFAHAAASLRMLTSEASPKLPQPASTSHHTAPVCGVEPTQVVPFPASFLFRPPRLPPQPGPRQHVEGCGKQLCKRSAFCCWSGSLGTLFWAGFSTTTPNPKRSTASVRTEPRTARTRAASAM